jgi:carbonic anhydrase/SulP family sulfate permease
VRPAPPRQTIARDLAASLGLFLVSLPLCLGVAVAAGVPPVAGLLAGVVGGLLVGVLSQSDKSVSGPAAGLISITVASVAALGSFEAFLLAVALAGLIQMLLGWWRAGFIASFFPGSVVKGLLAGIGAILILKQIPHLLGHDADPMGDKSFFQPDNQNTFTELLQSFGSIHPGALVVGLLALALGLWWERLRERRRIPVPSAVVVIGGGVALNEFFQSLGGPWLIGPTHLVQVPVLAEGERLASLLRFPDFSQLANPAIYTTALLIAAVASLETLLNVDAVDKIDPDQRRTPPNRELVAQGAGNLLCGLIGGLPVTSVIVRSSVNINAGARTKLSAVAQGVLLLLSVLLLPVWLNHIPLAAVAALLLLTGFKLIPPRLVKQMWAEGRNQFLPFIITVIAIVLTDPLRGILIGLGVSMLFLLHSNLRRPLRRIRENHAGGEVLRIELANQVSFLSRPTIERALHEVPRGGQVLLDARHTDYIDPDILDLIEDFRKDTAAAHGVQVSLVGFKDKYQLDDHIQYVDFSSREVQSTLTPERVLKILQDGHARFRSGDRLTRDLGRQVGATSAGQFPMAVVLSCIDSRSPAELIFDLGLGDIFSARIAGNIAPTKVLGSMEYSCAVAGAKLIVVMGHTSCGAVNAAVDLLGSRKTAAEATGCGNLDTLISEIQLSINPDTCKAPDAWKPGERTAYANEMARRNVLRTMHMIRTRSVTLDKLVLEGKVAIVGAVYDVSTGQVSFFQTADSSVQPLPIPMAVLA